MHSWEEKASGLSRTYTFVDFADAFDFVNKVAEIAEELQHHPDISFGWGYVAISCKTHDQDRITNKDHELAARIDAISN